MEITTHSFTNWFSCNHLTSTGLQPFVVLSVFCSKLFFPTKPEESQSWAGTSPLPSPCPQLPYPTSHSAGTSSCWGDPGHIKHPSCAPLSPVALDCSSRETLGCLKPTSWPRKASEEKNCFLAKLFLIAEVPFQNGASVGGCFGIIIGYKPSF